MVFILAMVLYPDVQRRAQAEIDLVIGRDQLPTFEDRASLPYIDAVLRETLRWEPVVPLGNLLHWVISQFLKALIGLPHATTSDDIYDGYFIPKGLLCLFNEEVGLMSYIRGDHHVQHMVRYISLRFQYTDMILGRFQGMKRGTTTLVVLCQRGSSTTADNWQMITLHSMFSAWAHVYVQVCMFFLLL